MMRPSHILLAALLCVAMATGVEAQRPGEHQVKAAVVLKLARFVEWPAATFADSRASMIIAVLGRAPIAGSLQGLVETGTGSGRPLRVIRVDRVEDLPACHILFVSASEKRRLEGILRAVESQPVLTVSDMEWFARAGGTIRLGFDEERLRMRVNLAAAEGAGLTISSRLLHLAEIVGGQER